MANLKIVKRPRMLLLLLLMMVVVWCFHRGDDVECCRAYEEQQSALRLGALTGAMTVLAGGKERLSANKSDVQRSSSARWRPGLSPTPIFFSPSVLFVCVCVQVCCVCVCVWWWESVRAIRRHSGQFCCDWTPSHVCNCISLFLPSQQQPLRTGLHFSLLLHVFCLYKIFCYQRGAALYIQDLFCPISRRQMHCGTMRGLYTFGVKGAAGGAARW